MYEARSRAPLQEINLCGLWQRGLPYTCGLSDRHNLETALQLKYPKQMVASRGALPATESFIEALVQCVLRAVIVMQLHESGFEVRET